jgi:hypothetical protein
VDIYGITAPATVTDDELLRLGQQIASLEVNDPPDPDIVQATTTPDESGVDQGATVRFTEHLTAAVLTPVNLPPRQLKPGTKEAASSELADVPTRVYAGVAVGARGRSGPLSSRAVVPLIDAPQSPEKLTVAYDAEAITLSWAQPAQGVEATYNVYDIHAGPLDGLPAETRLTNAPVAKPLFVDSRVEWGVERCYTVRAVQVVAKLTVESEAPPPTCVTLVDTFPPPPPSGLTTVASDGAISLIWDATSASDLAGYFVLRGLTADALTRVTAAPIRETTFRDAVPSGSRFVYAVQAVDNAGNVSGRTALAEDTAR